MLDHSGGRVPLSIGFKCNRRYTTLAMLLHDEGSVPEILVPKTYSLNMIVMLDHSGGRIPLNIGLEYS